MDGILKILNPRGHDNSKLNKLMPQAKNRLRRFITSAVRLFFLVGLSFMILYPVYVMISSSLLGSEDMFDKSVFLIPKHPAINSFRIAAAMMNYGTGLVTTLLVSLSIMLIQCVICLATGYGFGRFNFPLRNIIFAFVILTVVVPPQLYMTTLYMRFQSIDMFGLVSLIRGEPFNLVNQYTPLYLLALTGNGIKNGLFIYIFRQNFRNMPLELEEAALVDGAGTFKIFTRIMIPNSITTIVTVALFSFVWQYNDSFYAHLFKTENMLSNQYQAIFDWDAGAMKSLDLGLSDVDLFNPVFASSVRSAAALMIILPVLVIYLVAQRQFVQSIERSGIVG